jgi:drug/metabolite transporter (DMT)-like permease
LAQTLRFMLQKQLKTTGLSTGGATLARFIYSTPLIGAIALGYSHLSTQPLPHIPPRFWAFAISGGAAQLLATMCMVALFSHRTFAVGMAFKKTEVLLSVLVGIVLLGEGVSGWGFLAIILGLGGVLLLSDPPGGVGRWHQRIMNRSVLLGLVAGGLFAISGVTYRGASLALASGDTFQRAMVTLAIVTLMQTAALVGWLLLREAGEMRRVLTAWRVASLVGLASMVGSICWFVAFTLQTVAYVNALGQVELIFSLIVSVFVFSESVSRREWQGLALLAGSILVLVLLT